MAVVIIDNGGTGFSTVGSGWTADTSGTFYGSNSLYHAASAGAETASWNFTSLTGGTAYLIALTFQVNAAQATNCPWTIYDSNGSTVLASGTVNQQVGSVGQTSGGVMFQYLGGSVTPSGTSLTVTITDNANNYVRADAALIQLTTDPIFWQTLADGNWSAGSTWLPSFRAPGSGDHVSLFSHNVTVDVNTTIGTSPNTGGTPAITFNNGVASKALTIATGVALTHNGDIVLTATSNGTSQIVMNHGSSLINKPPSGQQYLINCTSELASLICNGTSGSRCTVKTDKTLSGLNGLITAGGGVTHRSQGLITAAYTDFTNFGTSTAWGINTLMTAPTNGNTSITNCTFTGCSYLAVFRVDDAWDGNATFSNNSFASSVTNTLHASFTSACSFTFQAAASSGTRVCQNNYFDDNVVGDLAWTTFSDNLINGSSQGLIVAGTAGLSPATAANCARNVLYYDSSVSGGGPTLAGPFKDWYFFNRASSNPHFIIVSASVVNGIVAGCIFEHGGSSADGDCVFPTTGSTTISVKNCLVLPNVAGFCSGKLVSALETGVAITAEHNTVWSKASEGAGVCVLGETGNSFAGEVASCRANIVYSDASSSNVLAVGDISATPGLDAVTLAGYNGFWNPNTGTCLWNTSTSQSGVTGYSGVKVSVNHNYPNTAVGTGDFTANPSFVDSTRDLANWGGTTAGGGVATVAGAIATLAANTALIGQASTGLLAWVRAGFVPTNAAYKAASYAGDTSTTDAAGNAWAGGSPGVGAMSFAAGGGSSYGSGRSNMSTRRAALSGAQVTRVYG